MIINPASAGGKTGKRQTEILRLLERYFEGNYSLCVTQKPFEACFSTSAAIHAGCELIIAIGGDGTIQEIVNGFFSDGLPINPACELGIISSGTGHGLAQSLGLPSTIGEQLDVICGGNSRAIDVGRVTFADRNGKTVERYFVNEFQAGIGGAVVRSVGAHQKRLGGLLAFGSTAFFKAIGHHAQAIDVVVDGAVEIAQPLLGVIIANGAYTAGGMHIAPRARVDDGMLDVLLIHEQSVLRRLWNFSKIYSGRHIRSAKFTYHQARQITIASSDSVPVEADGELLSSLPCTVDLVPAAVRVRSFISN